MKESLPIESQQNEHLEKIQSVMTAFILNFNSQGTMKEYKRESLEFLRFVLPKIKDLTKLRRDHLIFYKKILTDKGLAHKTIAKKLSAISSLCKFLAHEGIIQRDLTYGIKRPKEYNKKETNAFSEVEVRRIFESLNPKSFVFLSHRAILAVGFYTGLRPTEIRTLKVKNYTFISGHRIIKTLIKGSKPHEVPLNPFVIKCLDSHLKKLQTLNLGKKDEDYLFPRMRPLANTPLSAKGLRKILHSRLKDAGIPISSARRYSPQSMRATLATHLLNHVDAPLEDVQKLLGHVSPATTQKYNKRSKSHDKSPVYRIDY